MNDIKSNNTVEINKDFFIAYFDILGYESKVSKCNNEEYLDYFKKINEIVNITKELVSFYNSNILQKERNVEIKMKVFSDNFFFCVEKDFFVLVNLIACLQGALAAIDVFIRGSISYGNIIFNNDFIYGKGLIEAYKLENKIALFPRIIIDETYFKAIDRIKSEEFYFVENLLKPHFLIDTDLLYYLDYLYVMKDYKEKGEKDIDLKKFKEVLYNHAKNIKKNLSTDKKEIKQKYDWSRNYHNTYCIKNGFKEYIIND